MTSIKIYCAACGKDVTHKSVLFSPSIGVVCSFECMPSIELQIFNAILQSSKNNEGKP